MDWLKLCHAGHPKVRPQRPDFDDDVPLQYVVDACFEIVEKMVAKPWVEVEAVLHTQWMLFIYLAQVSKEEGRYGI
jgi:hypothetical protein